MTRPKTTIQPDDLFRLKFLYDAQFSPDGKMAAYAVSHFGGDQPTSEYVALWLMTLETGEARPLTTGLTRDTHPRWSPDGKQIAFLSDRADKPQLYLIPVEGGEAQRLTNLKQGVGGGPVWSPDGRQIAFTAGPAEEPLDLKKPYRLKRPVYRVDGMGYVDNALQDIFVMRANGAELRQLTWDDGNNFNPQWSPNGQELLYQASLQPDTGDYLPRLRVINLEGQVRTIIDKWGFASSAAWLPSGEGIVFVGAPSEVLSESIYDLWLVDRDGGQPRCRTASLKSGVGALLSDDVPALPGYVYTPSLQVSPDGQAVIIQIQDGGVSHLYRVALTGLEAATPIVTGERACTVADASDTHLLFGATQMNSPMDLYIARLNGEDERPLTHLNTSLLAERALPAVEHLRFPGPDGVLVEGWFLRPPAGKAPYPTVLYIHGGPNMSYGQPFCFDFQMLVGAGYGVLIVNERGSSGYGREFAAQIVGDLGNLDYQDLMAGVDVAVAQGLADPERLGCYGASAGGNLVCWIVGQTQRFKAAVAENPITNWVSYFGTTDVRSWVVEILGGRPYEIPEVYRRCSPITYAHRCITPTLLIQSENDFRCPAEQSEQFYAVLQSTGCETEMLRFPNSSHSASINGAPPIRRAQNEALLNWMNSHLLGQ